MGRTWYQKHAKTALLREPFSFMVPRTGIEPVRSSRSEGF